MSSQDPAMPKVPTHADAMPCATPPTKPPLRVVSTKELLQGETCVFIEHADVLYTLRATRNGKLILTK